MNEGTETKSTPEPPELWWLWETADRHLAEWPEDAPRIAKAVGQALAGMDLLYVVRDAATELVKGGRITEREYATIHDLVRYARDREEAAKAGAQ